MRGGMRTRGHTAACRLKPRRRTIQALDAEAVCGSVTLNAEEINALALNEAGGWLAAGDDAGEVQLVDLSAWRPGPPPARPAHRTLRRGHVNLVTALAFQPRSQWEVVSGGADCRLVHWDAGRLRQVSCARMQPPEDTGGAPGGCNQGRWFVDVEEGGPYQSSTGGSPAPKQL